MTLARGTTAYRIHNNKFAPNQFNHTRADDPYAGGRFDSARGDYGYLYLGSSEQVAVDEVLLRDTPFAATGVRVLSSSVLANRDLSRLRVDVELPVVDLVTAQSLAQVGQDYWLTDCDSFAYPHTRVWARAIRKWAPAVAGFVWRPRHNHEELAWVLFSDSSSPSRRPSTSGPLREESREEILTGPARVRIDQALQRRLTRVGP